MSTTTKTFMPANRYLFDFRRCRPADGWAQVDTGQDAWYYGTWANPATLEVVSYLEGDVYRTRCDDAAEFAAELRRIKEWNERQGWGFGGIDPMGHEEIAEEFRLMGLGDLLH